jgi:hypothetical protein
VWSLEKLGKATMTDEIVETLLQLDASDPMHLLAIVDEVRRGGSPVVDLSLKFPRGEESP